MVMQNFGENFVEWKPNEKLFRLLKQPLRSGTHSFIESKHIYMFIDKPVFPLPHPVHQLQTLLFLPKNSKRKRYLMDKTYVCYVKSHII